MAAVLYLFGRHWHFDFGRKTDGSISQIGIGWSDFGRRDKWMGCAATN